MTTTRYNMPHHGRYYVLSFLSGDRIYRECFNKK